MDHLPVAVRAWVEPQTRKHARKPTRGFELPRYALVLDTETTTDEAQALTFGSYRRFRIVVSGLLVRLIQIEEGIFHADDLAEQDPEGLRVLERYVARHSGLHLLAANVFVTRVLYPRCYRRRELLVGFNLPFDLSRLARGWGESRGPFEGGISLVLRTYCGPEGEHENPWQPRIGVKTIDSKRHLMGFTRPLSAGTDALKGFRGHLLDLRQLAFAWTDRSHSLASLCEALGVEHPKVETEGHGKITPSYVDYNRRDVQATAECLEGLLAEHVRHPIELQPTKAFSPASVGKAYLRAMGIRPIFERQPDFPAEVLAAAMCAYYGGRAECRIRGVDMPVVYLDFVSTYPTVNALMGLWRFVTAERIEPVEDTEGVRAFLERVSLEDCFDPATWAKLPAVVEVMPEGDVLPARALYEPGGTWNIGVNPLCSPKPLWYMLPDLVASRLLTGRVPNVLRAIRLVPVGQQEDLRPVRLRDEVEVDPSTSDFFRAVIEERKRLASRPSLSVEERERLGRFLKVLANSTSYGIYAEFVRHELAATRREKVTVHRTNGSTFEDEVTALEEPGGYAFPPLAACSTAAARLMLAMLECCVAQAGGTYVFCDTDSMAIVATKRERLLPCPGGDQRDGSGRRAARALSWAQVERIRQRFSSLNPYDTRAVAGSILELEKENVDPRTGSRRQLWCRSISAKRYAMFNKGRNGMRIRKCSEHGLGHLLNPSDAQDEDRAWIERVWERVVNPPSQSTEPPWLDRPAVGRITASTPKLLRPFASYNEGRVYRDQIKPFSFILSAQVAPFGYPEGTVPGRFHLIAPYRADPAAWDSIEWRDMYSGQDFRVTTSDEMQGADVVRLKSYGDVLAAHRVHPESKSRGPDGRPCGRSTRGLLTRRPVGLASLHYIGKESNQLEDVDAGAVHDLDDVLTEYHDPDLDPFDLYVRPVLAEIPKQALADAVGIHPRKIAAIRNGHAWPRARTRRMLTEAAASHARSRLRDAEIRPPRDHVAVCRLYLRMIERHEP